VTQDNTLQASGADIRDILFRLNRPQSEFSFFVGNSKACYVSENGIYTFDVFPRTVRLLAFVAPLLGLIAYLIFAALPLLAQSFEITIFLFFLQPIASWLFGRLSASRRDKAFLGRSLDEMLMTSYERNQRDWSEVSRAELNASNSQLNIRWRFSTFPLLGNRLNLNVPAAYNLDLRFFLSKKLADRFYAT
jgi:hypothetical protein